MLNPDTLEDGHTALRAESHPEEMSALLRDAWLTVCGTEHNGVTNLTPDILNRSGRGVFTRRFSQLKAMVQGMSLPVMTARTGVICL
ncbi:hypothetical protein [Enterobacter ludwigii]|uniref:hypothetical protein n=1 Tax=Enterobacter ludwigii TaxID=299767 RepID=UPI001865D6EB|nr:hypothetical protein [Enterobacter ludwigii]